MNWLVFALIGTASLAATGILDKFILSRYIGNSAAYLISLVIVQQLFALLISDLQRCRVRIPCFRHCFTCGFISGCAVDFIFSGAPGRRGVKGDAACFHLSIFCLCIRFPLPGRGADIGQIHWSIDAGAKRISYLLQAFESKDMDCTFTCNQVPLLFLGIRRPLLCDCKVPPIFHR